MNKKQIQNIILSKFEEDRDLSRLLILEDNLEVVLKSLSEGISEAIEFAFDDWEKSIAGRLR